MLFSPLAAQISVLKGDERSDILGQRSAILNIFAEAFSIESGTSCGENKGKVGM